MTPKPESPEPLPCPCGRQPRRISPFDNMGRVVCPKYGCWSGPLMETVSEAIAEWNRVVGAVKR